MNAELARVSSTIGIHVIDFCKERLANEPVFHAKDLLAFVSARDASIAPSSPTRILQALRTAGQVDYELLNRRKSEYRVVNVAA